MKLIMTGLPELMEENQQMLGELILTSMYYNNFKVDGIKIELIGENCNGNSA